MFDARLRRLIDPPLNRLGARLAAVGVSADAVTLAGFGLGVAAAGAIAFGFPLVGAVLIGLNRLADGLDGAIARVAGKTDRGGFLDITLDFAFYGLIPLAFALLDPAANAIPAAVLLASFYVNGAAFLAYARAADKRGLTTAAQGEKSFFYMDGIAEGGETIAVFLAWCLLPSWFAVIAYVFAAVTALSAIGRVRRGARDLR